MSSPAAAPLPEAPELGIVVPVKDEAQNLPRLVSQLHDVLAQTGRSHEILFVDDGSTDDSLRVIRDLQGSHPEIRWLQFERNRGKTAALHAGFRAARAEILIILDADCQNDPADIPRFLEAMRHYDIVCGYRQRRKDPKHRLIQSRIANRIRDWATRDGVRDSGCGYQALRRQVALDLKLFEGMHRFLPCMAQMEGYRFGQIPVRHHPRHAGHTKYKMLDRALRATIDLLAVRWMLARRIDYRIKDRG